MSSNKKNANPYTPFQIIIIVLFSIITNLLGRLVAYTLNLPLWLDSFGTFLTAYTLGPVCGAIVGVSCNCLRGLISPIAFVYSLTSIFIALVVGFMAKKGWLESLFKTMSLSVAVTAVCVVISVVLNITFYDGDIGNDWGNGIAELFESMGLARPVCIVFGQFYMDFLDKVITLVSLYYFIRLYRFLKPHLPKSLVIITAVTLLTAQNAFSKSLNYNSFSHTIYNKMNGLSGGKANDIKSTNDGILWVGTYEGLYRNNGHEFRLMNEFESIKAVRCLYVDDEGRLFVGTNDNGLSIIINECVMNVLEEKDGLPSDSVRSIIRGPDGLYFAGTSEDLAIISMEDGLEVIASIPEIQTAIALSADDDDHLAAVTAGGTLYILHDHTKIMWTSDELPVSEKFTAASFGPDGRLYAATESNHVITFRITDTKVSKSTELDCSKLNNINSINFYNGTFFLCADNGIGCLENGFLSILETGGFNNSIDNMTVDYQGNLWFTSSRLGLLKLCETSFSEIYASAGLPVSVVNSTARYFSDIYFATDNGLMGVDMNTGLPIENELTRMLSSTRIRCLTKASDGSLWICTKSKGLIHTDIYGNITTIGNGYQFRVAVELSDGTIAAGTGSGVAFIQNEEIIQWLTEEDGFENPVVLSLSETPSKMILAGTDGGGLAIIKNTAKQDAPTRYEITRLLKRSDGLSSNVILRTVNDIDGKKQTDSIFAVTSNSICYITFKRNGQDENPSIKVLTNFPFSNNYDLVIRPNKNIFVLSGAGIFVVNRDELLSGKKPDYELLDIKKGLRGSLTANSWNYLDSNGDLYISCDTGASRLNLDSYDQVEHTYRMQMKSILIDGKRHFVQKDRPFMINPDAETIEIVPEIINYSINTPYVSLYLEGVDEKPSVMLQSDISSLIYSKLDSGEYKFHIAILDSKRRDVVEEAVFTLNKPLKFYDNWWFKLYTVAVAVLAISWLTWYITSIIQGKRLEKQQKEMENIKKQINMGNQTIFSIANAVEARDKSTGRHSYRVAEYAVLIARELGFNEEQLNQIRSTGLLHDIGKIGVPDAILNKHDKLGVLEYEIMKTHTIIGGDILKDFTLIPHVDEGAKYHHEHYDGSGYPNGLKGEEIPLNARIIGIADAFDAMTADRVYRNALNMEFVTEELRRGAGTQFDPGLVKIMLELIESGRLDVIKTMEESSF